MGDISDEDIDNSVFQLGFEPLEIEDFPTGRLRDIMKVLEEKDPTVLTLDSLIFNESNRGNEKKEALALRVLQTFLYNVKPSVKTLSIRHNTFTPEAIEYLIEQVEIEQMVNKILYDNRIGSFKKFRPVEKEKITRKGIKKIYSNFNVYSPTITEATRTLTSISFFDYIYLEDVSKKKKTNN